MTADERLARWTAPLASPCAEPRAHPGFDAVRTEIAKLESPTGSSTDWTEVLRVGDAFLSEVGRDLIVASAVASALAHREGVDGIALGARLMTTLLADASATPARPRARSNALLAYAARAEMAIESAKDPARDALDSLDAALRDLANTSASALGADAPSLHGIRDRVRTAIGSLPATAAADPAPVFALPPPMPSPGLALAAEVPDRAEQVPAFVRRVATQLVASAALSRGSSALDPHALRLTLIALYLPITSAPETTRESRTALAAPPKLVIESLARQASSGTPDTLVRDAIGALERSRFALDVHVHLARGLEAGGATSAAAVHRHEVRGLLARLPALLDREFSDGTPFASADTRAFFAGWDPQPTLAPSSRVDSTTAIDEMRALAHAGRAGDALALGSRLRHAAASGRERFETTLAMAIIADEAHALPLAAELCAALVGDTDRHELDAWDPTLSASAIRAAVRIASKTTGGDSTARALFARLARVDARGAFELSSHVHATGPKSGR